MIMYAKDQTKRESRNHFRPTVRLLLGVLVTAASVWFIMQNVNLGEVGAALRTARPSVIALGVSVIILTGIAKAWRWRHLFVENKPRLSTSFWALMLNQFVNNVVPGRFGELARAHAAHQKDRVGRARSLGTIVVEKSIEMLFLLLSIFVFLPWVVLPAEFVSPTVITGATTAGLLIVLYFLAFQTNLTMRLVEMVAGWLPVLIGRKIVGITRSGLDGLAALRNPRAIMQQLGASTVITALYIVTPWVLFGAFDLPYGWLAAAMINFSTYLVILPPSIPGKFGLFEFAVIWVLSRLDPSVSEATLLSYALVYHLVTMLPPIVLGGIAAINSDWRTARE